MKELEYTPVGQLHREFLQTLFSDEVAMSSVQDRHRSKLFMAAKKIFEDTDTCNKIVEEVLIDDCSCVPAILLNYTCVLCSEYSPTDDKTLYRILKGEAIIEDRLEKEIANDSRYNPDFAIVIDRYYKYLKLFSKHLQLHLFFNTYDYYSNASFSFIRELEEQNKIAKNQKKAVTLASLAAVAGAGFMSGWKYSDNQKKQAFGYLVGGGIAGTLGNYALENLNEVPESEIEEFYATLFKNHEILFDFAEEHISELEKIEDSHFKQYVNRSICQAKDLFKQDFKLVYEDYWEYELHTLSSYFMRNIDKISERLAQVLKFEEKAKFWGVAEEFPALEKFRSRLEEKLNKISAKDNPQKIGENTEQGSLLAMPESEDSAQSKDKKTLFEDEKNLGFMEVFIVFIIIGIVIAAKYL